MSSIGAVGTTAFTAPTVSTRQSDSKTPAQEIRDGFTPSGATAPALGRPAFDPAPPSPPSEPPAEPSAPAKAKWTVLVYSAADNNLKSFLIQNLDDAEKVGSTPQTHVISQLDEGGRKGASRLYITKDSKPGLHSDVVEKLGNTDMANPKTLADFITWGQKKYPAEHYFLIISDHGDGWRGAVEDDSFGTWMKLPQIQEGLQMAREKTGEKIDVVGFDACLMANAEVAEQLKGECNYLVASEETEGGAGWPYTRVLSDKLLANVAEALLSKINLDPREFASHVVRSAETTPEDLPTMTALDMSKVDGVTGAVKNFADAILKSDATATLKQAARSTQAFYDTKDLYDFAQRVNTSNIQDDDLKKAAQGVMDAIKDATVAEEHSSRYPNAHGLTVQLDGSNGEYKGLPFAQQTGWGKVNDQLSGYKVAGERSH